MEAYSSSNVLSRNDRIFITHLIVDEFADEFGKLTREELIQRAAELKSMFPSVEEYVWYKPTFYIDAKGKKIKLGRLPQGCLFDRNHNYRSVEPVPVPKAKEQSSSSAKPLVEAITTEAVTSYQKTKEWFRHHYGEWDDIRKRWEATSAVRLHEISRLERITYQRLLDDYEVLKNSSGYQLVKLDFAFKYPDKCDLLFAKFADFRDRAKAVFRNEIPGQGKALLASLDGELTEDSRDFITTLLLFFVWPSKFMTVPVGKRWKPSIQERYESSILHLTSLADYETEISRLSKQNLQRGLPDHPVVVVVGATVEQIDQFLVSYKAIAYKTETFLKALDVAFKIYTAYGISFPIEATGPWNFIAHTLYDFSPPDNGDKPRILTLTAAFRNQTPAQ